jgi:hypothetical protein
MLPVYPFAVFPAASFAVTEIFTGTPAVAVSGTDPRTRVATVPGATVTGRAEVESVPSEAEIVRLPAVLSAKKNCLDPCKSVFEAGSTASESEDEIDTVPG